MKKYYGNYLGMVINNNDPEFRGRVQIYIPHIMPAMVEAINKHNKSITFNCVGNNLPQGLTAEMVEHLKQVLPWAEAASPILGQCGPGSVSGSGNFVSNPSSSSLPTIDNSSPVGNVSGNTATEAIKNAAIQFAEKGVATNQLPLGDTKGSKGGGLACAYSVNWMVRTALGHPIQKGDLNGLGTSTADIYSALKKNTAEWAPVDPLQAPAGSIIISPTGSSTKDKNIHGHAAIIVRNGKGKEIVGNLSRNNYDAGIGYDGRSIESWISSMRSGRGMPTLAFAHTGKGFVPAGPAGSASNIPPSPSPQQTANSSPAPPLTPSQSDPNEPSSTSPKPDGNQLQSSKNKLIQDRVAYFGKEIQNPDTVARLAYCLKHEGSSYPWNVYVMETICNRAMFLKKSMAQLLGVGDPMQASYWADGGAVSRNSSDLAIAKQAIQEVIYGGSNATDMATDNADNRGFFAAKFIKGGASGTFYIYPSGQKVTDKEECKKVLDEDKYAKAKYVLYYRKDAANNPNSGTGYGRACRAYRDSNNIVSKEGMMVFNHGVYDPQGKITSPISPNYTDPHGNPVAVNTNNLPGGTFTFPSVGAMVWTFFREGIPLYPVYFAASYSSEEWKAAYNGSSLDPLGANQGSTKNTVSNASRIHLGPAGGISTTSVRSTEDQTGVSDTSAISVYGRDGGNFSVVKGLVSTYAPHDSKTHTEGKTFSHSGGPREHYTGDDYNEVTKGNVFVKVGNIDQTTYNALDEIKEITSKINEMLMSTSNT